MPGQIRLLEADAYKEAVKDHPETPPEDLGLWKYHATEIKQVDDEERTLEFVISDGQVDRDRDVINPKGWNLKDFRKNPVVLWAHDYRSPPIGRAMKVSLEGDQLISRAKFTDVDMNPFGDMIFRMLQGKFLNAVSVGFRPTKYEFVQDPDNEERRGGINFDKQELLEFSVVPVPANPRALQRRDLLWLANAHEVGIDTSPLRKWAEEMLDLDKEIKGLTRTEIENAWEVITSRPLFVRFSEPDDEGTRSITFVDPEPEPEPEPEPTELAVCPSCRAQDYTETTVGFVPPAPDPNTRTCNACDFSWPAALQTEYEEMGEKLRTSIALARQASDLMPEGMSELILEAVANNIKDGGKIAEIITERFRSLGEEGDPDIEDLEDDSESEKDSDPEVDDEEVARIEEMFASMLNDALPGSGK